MLETRSIYGQDDVCSLARNWWTFVLRGVLTLVLAALAFLMPAEALLALTLVYGAFALVDGIFSLIAAMRKIRRGRQWGWLAFRGLAGLAAGAAIVILPFAATWVLAVFLWVSIAFWSALGGVLEVVTAWRLRKEIKGEFWLMLSGLISLLFSALVVWLLLTRPAESFIALGWLLGFYAVIIGAFLIMLGLRLRRQHKETRERDSSASPAAAG